MYCFNIGTLSFEGAQGKVGGAEGGGCLVGQEHGTSAGLDTPVLVQGLPSLVLAPDCRFESPPATVGVSLVLQLPIDGKSEEMTPRSTQASLDKNGYGIDCDT